MRKSKAQVFRPGQAREDILREPLSMFFNSISAFGKSKSATDESNAPRSVPIESQANVIANLIIYKQQEGAAGGEADVIGADQIRLSEIDQEVSNGFIDSLFDALKKHESEADEEQSKRVSCILPRTTFEFEKSASLQKIRAIRGLTPDKDIQIKLSDDSIALMASKVFHDTRFKAISTSNLQVGPQTYSFMRIKSQSVYHGSSEQFKSIHVLTSVENELNFIIMIPSKPGSVQTTNMHDMVKTAISQFSEQQQDI